MNVSKSVMIHVAVEVLAFSYLYSLLNKKTKSLEVELEELRDDYEKKMEDLYEKVEILKNAIIHLTKQEQVKQEPTPKSVPVTREPSKNSKKESQIKEQSIPSTLFVSLPSILSRTPNSSLFFDTATESKPKMEIIEETTEEKESEITEQDMKEIESLLEEGSN